MQEQRRLWQIRPKTASSSASMNMKKSRKWKMQAYMQEQRRLRQAYMQEQRRLRQAYMQEQ